MTFTTVVTYNRAQAALIGGEENRWFTGEAVGHDPDFNEELNHWDKSGAAARFAAANSHPGQIK